MENDTIRYHDSYIDFNDDDNKIAEDALDNLAKNLQHGQPVTLKLSSKRIERYVCEHISERLHPYVADIGHDAGDLTITKLTYDELVLKIQQRADDNAYSMEYGE